MTLYSSYLQYKVLITPPGAGSKIFSMDKDNILHPSSHFPIDVLLSRRSDILQCQPGGIFVLGNCHEACGGVEQLMMGERN